MKFTKMAFRESCVPDNLIKIWICVTVDNTIEKVQLDMRKKASSEVQRVHCKDLA